MTDSNSRKKLIEVALPLGPINEAAEKEMRNPFAKGHPKSFKWWARRPLGAACSLIFAQMIDDPSSRPDEHQGESMQARERARLLAICADLATWKGGRSRALTSARAALAAQGIGEQPTLIDPFAGGGTFPLAAAALGLDVIALDLNPVAVQINRLLLEVIPSGARRKPIRSSGSGKVLANALSEEVLAYSLFVAESIRAWATDMGPRHSGGSRIICRVAICPNPACSGDVPLLSSLWISRKKDAEAWLSIESEGGRCRFVVHRGAGEPNPPPKLGRGAKFKCPHCGHSLGKADVQTSLSINKYRGLVVAEIGPAKGKRRVVESPRPLEEIDAASTLSVDYELPDDLRAYWFKAYGFLSHADLYTSYQSAVLAEICRVIRDEVPKEIRRDMASKGEMLDERVSHVQLALAQVVSRLVTFNNTLSSWNATNHNVKDGFGLTAPTFAWDFVESDLIDSPVGLVAASNKVAEVIDALDLESGGEVSQWDARVALDSHLGDRSAVVTTDPPYYDNVTYSDQADFYYLWLRQCLDAERFPEVSTLRSPIESELVANRSRHPDRASADEFFETGFRDVFKNLSCMKLHDAPMVLVYAYKQSETDGVVRASTGWSTMLEGLIDSGWVVTATWPVVMERSARQRGLSSNALESSIVLSCRRRDPAQETPPTDRAGFFRKMRKQLPVAIATFGSMSLSPVDLRQAIIGPGIQIFSSFSRVVESDGSAMSVGDALAIVNQVADEALGLDLADFDNDTRWAIQWYSEYFHDEGPYGTAEKLAISSNVAIGGLAASGILKSGDGKVRLLARDELPVDWDPDADARIPVWEATQHLIRHLESDGEVSAGALLRKLDRQGLGESCKALAYRLFDVCESSRPELAGPYNMLAASWPEIQRLARQAVEPIAEPEQQSFDT